MSRTDEREGRKFGIPEFRAAADTVEVSGYAAVFNQETVISGQFREVIRPGAFDRAIAERQDVVLLWNHDMNAPMARTRAGNLILTSDDHGLKMTATLRMDNPDVQKLASNMAAGVVDKMSFAFTVPERGDQWDRSGNLPLRVINDANLFDVSAVTDPAYDGTNIHIAIRSLERAIAEERKEHNRYAAMLRRMRKNLAVRVAR